MRWPRLGVDIVPGEPWPDAHGIVAELSGGIRGSKPGAIERILAGEEARATWIFASVRHQWRETEALDD